jgi:hypothetical protein
MDPRIEALARRVRANPAFLASALAAYARSERLDEQGLAAALGCGVVVLPLLELCRRPRPEPALFARDVRAIAARFGVDAPVLAAAVRRSDVLDGLRRTPAAASAALLAARDRHDPVRSQTDDADDAAANLDTQDGGEPGPS